ncbi:STAS domain-containing protein [Vibrio sp. IRLE0018]|uniref:STAS domain-containing protein n=1 Tax=Vibrio TaxID=662 RepID=UPI001593E561|nr:MULTISPECIES: STAS domain-containing protein [Vibrio]MCF8777267.1 STAS domain-containing protein [Vibrio floridensis]NVC62614.1 STAS domain-containing protein [Vibrio sp. 05-20-BW147]HAS6346434.1 STAS domain-containing protein [Vibrio vulnificus]
MSVMKEVDNAKNTVTLAIEGAFGFNLVQEFRNAYSPHLNSQFIIDLRKVDYIDSAGLGMLLNMQKHLNSADGRIKIINTLPQVRKILLISRFDKKFQIE